MVKIEARYRQILDCFSGKPHLATLPMMGWKMGLTLSRVSRVLSAPSNSALLMAWQIEFFQTCAFINF